MCVLSRKLENTVLQEVDGCTFEDCTETLNCQLCSTLDGWLAKKLLPLLFLLLFLFLFLFCQIRMIDVIGSGSFPFYFEAKPIFMYTVEAAYCYNT
jgi:hypothetical protein